MGRHAEFLRWGLKIDKFTENVEACLKLNPSLKLTFLVTYQALSPFNFEQFLEFVLDLRKRYPKSEIKVGVSTLVHPEFLSLLVLDKSFTPYLEKNLAFMQERRMTGQYPIGFSEFEVNRFARILSTFKNSDCRQNDVLPDFNTFISEYERRKNVKFSDYFGEFPDLLRLRDHVP